MSRFLLVALVAVLAFPAAAAAKGPHASLSVAAEAPQPGELWTAKLRVVDFGRGDAPPPLVTARSGGERVSFAVQELPAYVPPHPDVLRERPYRLRGVFPSAGEWLITVVEGPPRSREFRLPPLEVGGTAPPMRHLMALPGEDHLNAAPLPPEVVEPPEAVAPPAEGTEDEPARLWIPAAGVALAAGALALVRRRRR